MNQPHLKLHLHPRRGGAFSELRLSGCVTTAMPLRELRRWTRQLSRWSGGPVEFVLPADEGTDAWFQWWTDALRTIPERHLLVRFTVAAPERLRRGRHGR